MPLFLGVKLIANRWQLDSMIGKGPFIGSSPRKLGKKYANCYNYCMRARAFSATFVAALY